MKIQKLSDMWRGWFIGNFEPTVLKTEDFEVGYLFRPKGKEQPHYHAIGTEYNVLISGTMLLNGNELVPGDIFIIEPNEIAYPEFHEDCYILCVKTPSVIGDKYEVL
jgi:quercetin dioxygenase-like cupin family protein